MADFTLDVSAAGGTADITVVSQPESHTLTCTIPTESGSYVRFNDHEITIEENTSYHARCTAVELHAETQSDPAYIGVNVDDRDVSITQTGKELLAFAYLTTVVHNYSAISQTGHFDLSAYIPSVYTLKTTSSKEINCKISYNYVPGEEVTIPAHSTTAGLTVSLGTIEFKITYIITDELDPASGSPWFIYLSSPITIPTDGNKGWTGTESPSSVDAHASTSTPIVQIKSFDGTHTNTTTGGQSYWNNQHVTFNLQFDNAFFDANSGSATGTLEIKIDPRIAGESTGDNDKLGVLVSSTQYNYTSSNKLEGAFITIQDVGGTKSCSPSDIGDFFVGTQPWVNETLNITLDNTLVFGNTYSLTFEINKNGCLAYTNTTNSSISGSVFTYIVLSFTLDNYLGSYPITVDGNKTRAFTCKITS